MGQSNSVNYIEQYNIKDNVLTQDQFYEIIKLDENGKSKKKLFHEQMLKANIWAKIFICPKETDKDRADPDYIENCEIDEICDDYKNRYYVAHLSTKQVAQPNSIADLIWMPIIYHKFWAYVLDIYEYHKLDSSYKKLVLKDYYVCDNVIDRKGYNMSNDLDTIFNVIKKLDRDIIEKNIIIKIIESKYNDIKNQLNAEHKMQLGKLNQQYNEQIDGVN